MKKLLAVLLALAMSLSLVACGGDSSSGSGSAGASGSASGDKILMGLSMHNQSADWAVAFKDAFVAAAEAKGEPPFFVVCDELEDPHNFGAILRTAETAGVHGVVIPKRRSAGLTSAVYKASAGAVEYVPVARVSNITDALREMKKRGVWVYGLDMDGETWCSVDMKGAAAVVVGSEGRGISRLVKEQCDFIVSLPMRGHITSLNASVACGIVLYEAARQRQGLAAK